MCFKYKIYFFIILAIKLCNGQENIQTRIPNSLAECYENPQILERDRRLPMNINILIELIRKVEDDISYNQDIRQLAVSLLHRFKLDGIEKASGTVSSKVLPFSPSGYQFSKHRIILSRLIPGNGNSFPNNTLTAMERCTLHFMLSNSIETRVRGDEATRCNQLAQFRAMRVPRDLFKTKRSVSKHNNYIGDMELMEELELHERRKAQSKKSGRYQAADEDVDLEERVEDQPAVDNENEDDFIDPANRNGEVGLIDVASNSISQCPVENGVVRTMWGEISAGSLIAGIAAGLEPQKVMTRDLLALSRGQKEQQRSRQTQQTFAVDNKWAATLAGDLAEVALLQGPVTQQISVGAPGVWNQTLIPRWYFLSQRERLEMTDAEIRGGLDGLILGSKVIEFRGRASQLKLSQLLDMYYSQRGVYTSNVRSCDRRELFTSVAPVEEMRAQTIAFSSVLDREMQLRVTLSNDAISTFSDDASQALSTYVPQTLSDLSCSTTSIVPNDKTIWRTGTDIYIYVDASWTFKEIQPIVSYLIENLDVNRFGSSYTVYNAKDASVIIDTTSSISTFYTAWNNSNYQNHPVGLDLSLVFRHIHDASKLTLDQEQSNSSVGGRSHIALIIPQMSSPNDANGNDATERLLLMREEVPDLVLLFLAGGAASRFERFARERRDIFAFQSISSEKENVPATVNPVIRRIQEVPRRIINHRCGSKWQSNEWGESSMNQFVEQGGINFYRLHPNYYFAAGENQKIRIQGQRQGLLSVCMSRNFELPRANSTNSDNDIDCRQINGESYDINLSKACEPYYLIKECPPIYVSVEGIVMPGSINSFSCTDRNCRFPDSIRYTVHTENLGCFSGAERVLSTLTFVMFFAFLVLRF